MSRTKGSLNKPRQIVLKKLQLLLGDEFDPIVQMAKNAHGMQQMVDAAYGDPLKERLEEEYDSAEIEARRNVNTEWGRVAEYIQPKLKSIQIEPGDLEDEDGNPVESKLILEVVHVQKGQGTENSP